MKKMLMMSLVILAMGTAVDATAGCTTADGSSRISNQGGIQGALSGKRIHAVSASDDWNEDHCAGGDLYKVGDGTAVDPRAKRGTWSIAGSGNDRSVRYAYTGDPNSPYTWTLWQNASQTILYFCNGTTEVAHTVSIGNAGTPCN